MSNLKDVPPLPAQDWPSALDHVHNDMNGAPINVHKLMAHSPELLKAGWDFRNYAVRGGTLGPYLAELAILRIGMRLGNWYEWASHVERALRIDMPMAVIRAVMSPDVSGFGEQTQRYVLMAVDELLAADGISHATRSKLEETLRTDQIMDLIAIFGMYVTLDRMIKTWGLDLDETVEEALSGVISKEEFLDAAHHFGDK